jgi:hypothetical protein
VILIKRGIGAQALEVRVENNLQERISLIDLNRGYDLLSVSHASFSCSSEN